MPYLDLASDRSRALFALKCLHETDECRHRLNRYSIVERHAYSSHGAMPQGADQPCHRSFLSKARFNGFIAARAADSKNYVHFRSGFGLDRAIVKPAALVDRIVKQLSLGVVSFL